MQISRLLCLSFAGIALAGAGLVLSAEQSVQQVMAVTVEQRIADTWKPVNSQTVFHAKDDIRFRLQSRMPGYLYVLNHASGGDQSWLYPRPEHQTSNQIEANKSYL